MLTTSELKTQTHYRSLSQNQIIIATSQTPETAKPNTRREHLRVNKNQKQTILPAFSNQNPPLKSRIKIPPFKTPESRIKKKKKKKNKIARLQELKNPNRLQISLQLTVTAFQTQKKIPKSQKPNTQQLHKNDNLQQTSTPTFHKQNPPSKPLLEQNPEQRSHLSAPESTTQSKKCTARECKEQLQTNPFLIYIYIQAVKTTPN